MVQDAQGNYRIKRKKKKGIPRKGYFSPQAVTARLAKKNPTRNYYLYALKLENGNYYVGVTSHKDATKRYEQHVEGKGSKWTKLHKPIKMIEVRDIGMCRQTTAIEVENLMTREYMAKYGMYKVRGGDLCYIKPTLVALHFNDATKKTINYDINGKRISRSHKHLRQVEKIQEDIASELSWIV